MDNPADVLSRNDGVQSMDISDFALDGRAADFGAWGKVNADNPHAPVLGQDLYRAAKKATGARNQDFNFCSCVPIPQALDPHSLAALMSD
jgi:hypothetical protein